MNPVVAGLLAALSWGTADFAARFTTRKVGPQAALLAVMTVGAATLTVSLALGNHTFPTLDRWSAWDVANGLTTAVSMLMFYEALRRGPLSLVSPLVGSYPVWALAIGYVFFDLRIAPSTALAMAVTLAGIWIVASSDGGPSEAVADECRPVGASLAAGALFGLALIFAQQATVLHGPLPALWIGRLIGLAGLSFILYRHWRRLRASAAWTAVLTGQGLLDTFGYLFLYASGIGVAAGIATVISATFGLVTVLLARLLLRERIGARQWGGIALVFAGVAALSAT